MEINSAIITNKHNIYVNLRHRTILTYGLSTMWKEIGSEYFLTCENDFEVVYITDYISIWSKVFTESEFLTHLKVSNELLTLPGDNEFIQNGVKMLSNPKKLKKHKIIKEDNGNTLFLSMTILFGYPFTFECRLMKGSDEMYFQKITQILLKTIKDLRSSESELRFLLKKKDKEINKYKEDGENEFWHLKTEVFNDEKHMQKYNVYCEYFRDGDIPTSLLNKNVPLMKVWKEESAQNVKSESRDSEEITTNEPLILVAPKQEYKIEPKTEQITSPRKKVKKLNY